MTEKMIDMFLLEAEEEIAGETPAKKVEEVKKPVPAVPAAVEEPTTSPTPPEEEEVEPDEVSKEKIKYEHIDLDVVNATTSKMFSFEAFNTLLKHTKELQRLQSLIPSKDKEIEGLTSVKYKTDRLISVMNLYILNLKEYSQEDIDTIRPKFNEAVKMLVKETHKLTTNI